MKYGAAVCTLALTVLTFAKDMNSSKHVATLSNVGLPKDTNGNLLITGEASVLNDGGGNYYFYFNDWGGCPGIDCCNTSAGCASCCFAEQPYVDRCVYTDNHSVVVYLTNNFVDFEYKGVALGLLNRLAGVEFRPHVVYNERTGTYVMWYEDRNSQQKGYAVATSKSPSGPFQTIKKSKSN